MKRKIFVLLMLSCIFTVSGIKIGVSNGNIPIVKVYTTNQLEKSNILETRKNKNIIVIEKITGVVIDNNKNGKINTKSKYNYISYKGVKGAKKGNKIVTYLLYNPDSNYIDDVVYRYDKVI